MFVLELKESNNLILRWNIVDCKATIVQRHCKISRTMVIVA